MKSFYQLSEQARRHQTKKAMNEAGVAPAPAAGQPAPTAGQPAPTAAAPQQQQAQPNPAVQASTAFQQAWEKFAADQNNKMTLDTLKKAGFDASTTLATALKAFTQKLGTAPAPAAAAPATATPAVK